jgi:hypothetical protein
MIGDTEIMQVRNRLRDFGFGVGELFYRLLFLSFDDDDTLLGGAPAEPPSRRGYGRQSQTAGVFAELALPLDGGHPAIASKPSVFPVDQSLTV